MELNNAARNTDYAPEIYRLVAEGADLASTNGGKWRHTPLHQACFHNRPAVVEALLSLGAYEKSAHLESNPCGRGGTGTPMDLASPHPHIQGMLRRYAESRGNAAPASGLLPPGAAAANQNTAAPGQSQGESVVVRLAGFAGYNERLNGSYIPMEGNMVNSRPTYTHTSTIGVGANMDWCRMWFAGGAWRIGHFSWVYSDPMRCIAMCRTEAMNPNEIPDGQGVWLEHPGRASNKDHSNKDKDFRLITGVRIASAGAPAAAPSGQSLRGEAPAGTGGGAAAGHQQNPVAQGPPGGDNRGGDVVPGLGKAGTHRSLVVSIAELVAGSNGRVMDAEAKQMEGSKLKEELRNIDKRLSKAETLFLLFIPVQEARDTLLKGVHADVESGVRMLRWDHQSVSDLLERTSRFDSEFFRALSYILSGVDEPDPGQSVRLGFMVCMALEEDMTQADDVQSEPKAGLPDRQGAVRVIKGSLCKRIGKREGDESFRLFDMESECKLGVVLSKASAQSKGFLTATELNSIISAVETCKAVDASMDKFTGELKDLRTGRPEEAATGLQDYMCVESEALYMGVSKGVAGIEEEANAFGGEVAELVHYIVHEKASEKKYPNGVRDAGRSGTVLSDFTQHPNAVAAGLSDANVVAMRLYTTAAYTHMNGPLRDTKRQAEGKPCPLPVATWFAQEGIKKMRKLRAKQAASDGNNRGTQPVLWRGMRNIQVTNDFLGLGGTELAFMSTTSDVNIAVSYSLSSSCLLFKVNADTFMQVGAELDWLSAFPSECEVLYPPLTYLSPTGEQQEVVVERPSEVPGAESLKVKVTVVEVEPHMS
eukprot:CAMPEP_0114128694 /NCGR_PEP_ID=MMETSP0043_2-20121206/11070_1 /TAXON_ID=464988 /ORGANISM="Hemiselmis andersenii, Strain CCMP644" /LENGTH=820 /DNA_ID=CAMNT_0001221903 /DNA_START=108 /DNA_END=2570 /DNA_ORIENTATION=+